MSFATDDLHSPQPPPLLFHHIHRDLRNLQHQQHQLRSSVSYPSHDLSHHHLQDPRQSPYSAHLALNSAIVPRQSPNHADSVIPPDQQFIIPAHPQALDMQQQHHPWATVYDHNGTLAAGYHSGITSLPSFPFTGNSYHHNHPSTPPPPTVNNAPISGSVSSTGVGGIGGSQNETGGGRMTLAGSLDPSTGIFYRTPEHPRLRTAQACEKCRTRKAKCSGEHPTCKRCQTRGLICEYAKEGRVRGPNKPKSKAAVSLEDQQQQQQRNYPSPRTRAADHGPEMSQAMLNALREQDAKNLSTLLHRRDSLSLGEHRANRPRPPNLNLDPSSRQFRLEAHAFHLDSNYQLSQHTHTTHTAGAVVNHYLPPTEEQHMIHTAPPASQIPINTVNYHAIPPHIQVGTISPSHGLSIEDMSSYTYEENRSPSTSSSASIHGSTTMATTGNQSMVHIQNTYALENGLVVDHNSAASSPSAYRTSGDMTSSPTIPAPGISTPSGSGGGNTSFGGIHPIDANASLPLVDHAWVSDINGKNDFATMQFSHDAGADDHAAQDVLLHHQHHAAMSVQRNAGVYAMNAMNAVGDDVVGNAQVQSLYPIDLRMR